MGLRLITALSVALLAHQGLIKLSLYLFRRRKLPHVYRLLTIITGSGYYRWKEGWGRLHINLGRIAGD